MSECHACQGTGRIRTLVVNALCDCPAGDPLRAEVLVNGITSLTPRSITSLAREQLSATRAAAYTHVMEMLCDLYNEYDRAEEPEQRAAIAEVMERLSGTMRVAREARSKVPTDDTASDRPGVRPGGEEGRAVG